MSAVEADARLIAEWRSSPHPYKVIAAAMAEWAVKHEAGVELPDDDNFAGNLPIVASDATWKRAKALLARNGVLALVDSRYVVA